MHNRSRCSEIEMENRNGQQQKNKSKRGNRHLGCEIEIGNRKQKKEEIENGKSKTEF